MDNVKKVYTFNFFWLFVVILPVLYPYYSSLGVNMHQFFQLQAAFGLTVALLDIPTGFFSDRYGRKLSLALGGFISGLGYLVLITADGFGMLLIHEILLGMALSFVSGADIAILYDSLPSSTSRRQFWQALGKTQLAYSSGESLGAILCALLVALSYHSIVIVQAVISWLPFLVALTLTEPPQTRRVSFDLENIRKMARLLVRDSALVRDLTVNFVMWLLSTFIIIWMVQRYWQDQQIPLAYFGYLWALYNVALGITAYFSHSLEEKFPAPRLVLAIPVLCCFGYFMMSFLSGWWGAAAALLIYVGRGINNVALRDLLNAHIPSELRSTANSILNFMFRLTFALVGPAVGWSIDAIGIRRTLLGLGLFFLFGAVIFTRPLLKKLTPRPI